MMYFVSNNWIFVFVFKKQNRIISRISLEILMFDTIRYCCCYWSNWGTRWSDCCCKLNVEINEIKIFSFSSRPRIFIVPVNFSKTENIKEMHEIDLWDLFAAITCYHCWFVSEKRNFFLVSFAKATGDTPLKSSNIENQKEWNGKRKATKWNEMKENNLHTHILHKWFWKFFFLSFL